MGLLDFLGIKPDPQLLEWQSVIVGHPVDKPTMARKELEYWSHSMARDSIRIIQDSSRIVHETKDPEVFFSRFDLLEQHYGFLCALSKFIKTTNEPPEAVLAAFRETKQEEIYRFISRYYTATCEKALTLKTASGKKNRFQKFYDSLQPYLDEMDDHNRNYVNYKYKGAMKMVEKL